MPNFFHQYVRELIVCGGVAVKEGQVIKLSEIYQGENSMAKSKEFEGFNVSKADNGFVVYVGREDGSYRSAENTFVFKTPAEVGNFIKEQVAKM